MLRRAEQNKPLGERSAHGFTEMQNGLPIVVDGEVIGAIGASFDTPEHDVQIALAGLAPVPR
jgi:glc operon protein GlcG